MKESNYETLIRQIRLKTLLDELSRAQNSMWRCFLFILQISYRLQDHQRLKLLWEDLIFTIVFLTETFLWRGGWNLDTTFIIKDPLVGGLVNHCIGTFLLMSFQLFGYVGTCGCILDNATPCERDVIYDTKYLRSIFRSSYEKVNQVFWSNCVTYNISVVWQFGKSLKCFWKPGKLNIITLHIDLVSL